MNKKKRQNSSTSPSKADDLGAHFDTSSKLVSDKAQLLTYKRSALVQKLLGAQKVGGTYVTPVLYGEDAKRVYEEVKRQMADDEWLGLELLTCLSANT